MPKVTVDEHQAVELEQTFSPLHYETMFKLACRQGKCGMCKVRVSDLSAVTPETERETKLKEMLSIDDPQIRLACQFKAHNDLTIETCK
ncbi:2Fe-2S iron-sulfur cluster-binding protein [Vibrio sp. 10N.261.46.E11]|uniref:2Fe-2S iron-sulfur cluster-binding protein n=1 Tax=Vibrio sp. 10N.261.46.E11 TaxID=3229662 RepID=UPI00354E33BF